MLGLIREMNSREDQDDSEAIPYGFSDGNRHVVVWATTYEGAWEALESDRHRVDEVDDWELVSIDGEELENA